MPELKKQPTEEPTAVDTDKLTIEPFKVVGKLVAAVKNEKGEVIGEQPVTDLVLWAPRFHLLKEDVEQSWPEIERTLRAQANGQ
jgi:hypothetical protein